MKRLPKLLVFASGSKEGGGSGFQELAENAKTEVLKAEIAGVVSNHPEGGVKKKADKLGVPFEYFPGPFETSKYREIVKEYNPDFIALSGWLKLVKGLDPKTTINIHPAPLPRFGGKGMYGIHVHEAVIEAFRKGEIKNSAVSMHFATEKYDEGPIFFEYPVRIRKEDTAESLGERVNKIEHGWQSFITNLVTAGEISWDGKDPKSLKVPDWLRFQNLNQN